jgi:hypothetical protein
MGFLDWVRGRATQVAKQPEKETFLSFGERAALKRIVQHFDDGLVGWQPGKPRAWETDLEAMATRLGFRDPFGDTPVRLEGNEVEAVSQLHAACQKDAEFGDYQMKSDIGALQRALERDGKPQPLPAWELGNAATSSSLPAKPSVTAKGPEGGVEAKPSRTHSIFSDYPDRILKTEADVRKDDALLDMTLVVNEIANDPNTNWRKYNGDFEKAVNGMREAFGPEMRSLSDNGQDYQAPNSARVHFWREAWEPGGYAGVIEVDPGSLRHTSLERAFAAFNGQDDHINFSGPSASVGDRFIYETNRDGNVHLFVYEIKGTGYERLHPEAYSTEMKGWIEKSFGRSAEQMEMPVTSLWTSGKIERSGFDPDGDVSFTERSWGVLGQSAEGFHYLLEQVYMDRHTERTNGIPNAWSEPLETKEAAAREMKKALVNCEREFATDYGVSRAGIYSKVGNAVRQGTMIAQPEANRHAKMQRGDAKPPQPKKGRIWER